MAGPLGERLRHLRGERGMSQSQMGKLFGMSQSAYERIESGRSRHQASTLERIDRGMIDAGFDWHVGLARRLDIEARTADGEVIERLERLEAKIDQLLELHTRTWVERQVLDEIRRLLAED